MKFLSKTLLSWLFLFALLLVTTVQAGEAEDIELAKRFSARFPTVMIDARGSRGGNGDIAAAYLTITDWLQNYKIESRFTVLVDENGKSRLENLAVGNDLFASRVSIIDAPSKASREPYSFYAVFASPSGTYRYADDIGSNIRMRKDSALMVQTVLGNTENPSSLHPNATIEAAGQIFDWAPAGLASSESGIYTDTLAQSLRPMNAEQVRGFILDRLPGVTHDFSRESLKAVLQGDKLKGAKTGLVYGLSTDETRNQFSSYLHGLLINQPEESHVLFTPSSYRENNLRDESLKDKIVFLTSVDEIPEVAAKGVVYMIETKRLPHNVFVALIAYSMKSKVVPVGAGDGFLSAAIDLGGPFVLTQVAWNKANVAQLKTQLLDLALEHKVASADVTFLKELLKRNFEKIDFRTAFALKKFAPLFALLKTRVPRLSRRALEVALASDHFATPQYMPLVQDMTLQKSVLKGGRKTSLNLQAGFQSLRCSDAFSAGQ